MKKSRKIEAYFELAGNVALQSTHLIHKHGAVLVKGGKVINTAFNDYGYSRFAYRFVKSGKSHDCATRHAELSVILNMPRSLTYGADIYVVRINNEGVFKLSKPCPMCMSSTKFCGVNAIYYSIDGETVGRVKL